MKIDNVTLELVAYGLSCGLISEYDEAYTVGRIMEILNLSDYAPDAEPKSRELSDILSDICDYAFEVGLIENNSVVYRDLFDTKIMGALMPRPSEFIAKFE